MTGAEFQQTEIRLKGAILTVLSWELRKRSVSTIVATTVCVIACLGVQASPTLLDIAAGKRQLSSICCGFCLSPSTICA